MVNTLLKAMAFELGEGTPADVEDMITIILLGFESDEMWSIMMRNVTPEDKRANARQIFEKRFQLPKFPFIVIREKEIGFVFYYRCCALLEKTSPSRDP